METAVGTSAETVIDLEARYLFQNYARYPLVLQRGKGCYVYDTSGKRYLDLIAGIGVNALGHAHPRLMKVIREQAGRLLHGHQLRAGPRCLLEGERDRLRRCGVAVNADDDGSGQ